jgi:hypothetical protein
MICSPIFLAEIADARGHGTVVEDTTFIVAKRRVRSIESLQNQRLFAKYARVFFPTSASIELLEPALLSPVFLERLDLPEPSQSLECPP